MILSPHAPDSHTKCNDHYNIHGMTVDLPHNKSTTFMTQLHTERATPFLLPHTHLFTITIPAAEV